MMIIPQLCLRRFEAVAKIYPRISQTQLIHVVITCTFSVKSRCYNFPILDTFRENENTERRTLAIFFLRLLLFEVAPNTPYNIHLKRAPRKPIFHPESNFQSFLKKNLRSEIIRWKSRCDGDHLFDAVSCKINKSTICPLSVVPTLDSMELSVNWHVSLLILWVVNKYNNEHYN